MKRKAFEIKYKILSAIKEKPLACSDIQKLIKTNYYSTLENCREIEFYGFVKFRQVKNHPGNGRRAQFIEITPNGLKILEKFEENFYFR